MAFPDTPLSTPYFSPGYVDAPTLDSKIVGPLNQLQARVDDSGWTNLAITGSWASVSGNALKYRIVGQLVVIEGSAQRTGTTMPASSTWSTNPVATLPAAASPANPSSPLLFAVAGTTPGANMQVKVASDGTIQVRNVGTVALAVNDYMDVNVSFLLG